jgi:hypothetical protein
MQNLSKKDIELCRSMLYSLESDLPEVIVSCMLEHIDEGVKSKIEAFVG